MDRTSPTQFLKGNGCLIGKFQAMGCDCEILMDTEDGPVALRLLQIGSVEAWRIEKKFSRYTAGNTVHQINNSAGKRVRVDDETAQLIDFADRCYQLSGGLFDITSGILRKVWKFDGSNRVPKHEEVNRLLPWVGWNKVEWKRPCIRLAPGMEIDLGGIGKEYAVDRTLQLLRASGDIGVLVNFGGDVAAAGDRKDNRPWVVGIENVDQSNRAARVVHVRRGALATSGDSKRFVRLNGKRYGHILDPRTGWPVPGAHRSVTVAANTCTEAGFLSTLGILSGKKAASVLREVGVRHWCY